MTTAITLAAKSPDEKYAYSWTPTGDDIGSTPTIDVIAGSATLDGVPTLIESNTAVRFVLTGGEHGETTIIEAVATMANGDIIEQQIIVLIREPQALAIDLADAKQHLRVDADHDDSLIIDGIRSASAWVEDYTGLVLARREITERLKYFGTPTKLTAWPIAADQPVVINYRDSFAAEQTITNAVMRAGSRPGVIYPANGALWPARNVIASDIEINFTAGFADVSAIPIQLKRAMLVLLTAFYEEREAGPMFEAAQRSARSLCRRFKRHTL